MLDVQVSILSGQQSSRFSKNPKNIAEIVEVYIAQTITKNDCLTLLHMKHKGAAQHSLLKALPTEEVAHVYPTYLFRSIQHFANKNLHSAVG